MPALTPATEALRAIARETTMIYTDLDGTMLGRGGAFTRGPGGEPAIAPAEALVSAHRAGIEIVPCSGRAHRGLVSDGRILGLPTVIADMGAVLSYETGRETVLNLGAWPGVDGTPVDAMERGGAVDLLLRRYAGRLELHMPWAQHREYTQLFRGKVDLEDADAALEAAGAGWVHLVDNGKLSARYLDLPEGDTHVYHLLPHGVSKGTAIAMDRYRRSIPRDACVAIGDAIADLEIASEVAALVLVRDAVERHPDLEERASSLGNVLVTSAPGNLGWAETVLALASVR